MPIDLIKTINDGDDVPDYSESSDEEEDFQPSKQKVKKKKDFDTGFNFVSSTNEYNRDIWNDLAKYVKRKGHTKVDDKIQEARKSLKKDKKEDEGSENEESDPELVDPELSDDELSISDDELKKDNIRVKEKPISKRQLKKIKLAPEPEAIEFEEQSEYNENLSFYEMNLSRPLLKAISALNYSAPTPIQCATIPVALLGRDICGCAATGTGKTAAYMLPTLERLIYRPKTDSFATRVLVLVPTRELGVQVYQVTKQLSQFTNIEVGLAVGGLDVKVQESILRKNPDIVIATPGRLIDHLQNCPSFGLESVEVLVLDEADRMLDENFEEQMKEIIKMCSRTRQTLLFSATMTDAVHSLAAVSLSKPVKIFVDSNQNVAANLRQEFVKIRKEKESDREPVLAALICRTFHHKTMIFVQTKKQAHRLHILLGLLGVKVGELHGDLTQAQRLESLRKFRDEVIDVLVATDVAARGLDIKGVQTVVNFTLPVTLEQYIHRVGRTARAGRSGVSVSLAGEGERKILKAILKNSKAGIKARLIPPEILDKYRKKLANLEDVIKGILQQEYEERQMMKAEQNIAKAERILNRDKKKAKTEKKDERSWFQTNQERKQEKAKLRLTKLEPVQQKRKRSSDDDSEDEDNDKSKKKKTNKNKEKKFKKWEQMDPDERVQREMQKVALLQARMAKSKSKPSKIKRVDDNDFRAKKGQNKKKGSKFDHDLTDTSRRGVKKLRHEVQAFNNENKYGSKNAKGKGPKGKGNSGPKSKGSSKNQHNKTQKKFQMKVKKR